MHAAAVSTSKSPSYCILVVIISVYITLLFFADRFPKSTHNDINPLHPSTDQQRWTYVGPDLQAWRTAHFESRYQVYGGPAVIVIAFHPKMQENKPNLYCKVTYSNGTSLCLRQKAKWFEFLRSSPKPNEIFVAYNIIWRLPSPEKPLMVSISMSRSCLPASAYIPLFKDYLIINGTVGLCLHKAIFNEGDAQRVAAWIELNKALGAELITIYYQKVTQEVENVIQYYANQGIVEALDWKINISNKLVYNTGQLGTIQDCFYRNFNRFKYMAFYDIDEFIVPHRHATWQGMLKVIDKPWASYFEFYNSFWHDVGKIIEGSNITKRRCSQLKTPVFFKRTNRTANLPPTKRHKMIVKPQLCYHIDIHNIKSQVKGYRRLWVPEVVGIMHHYRQKDYTMSEKQTEDLSLSRYTEAVMKGLYQKFCD